MERVFWKLSEMYRVRIESLAATGQSVAERLRHAGSTISREQRRGCEAEQADAPAVAWRSRPGPSFVCQADWRSENEHMASQPAALVL